MSAFIMTRRSIASAILGLCVLVMASPSVRAADDLIALLKQPGHIGLMRHALAPFDGAPREGGMTAEALGPCETQRNLDAVGRAEATRIGVLFRASGIMFDRVYTSKWCRCRETAELIMGRPVENLPLINSFYTAPDSATKGPAQIAKLKAYLNTEVGPRERILMVTHGSLITALVGIDTDEAEMVIVKADGKGGVAVVGRGVPGR
jgi:phosphohistidine phosphatase SixA